MKRKNESIRLPLTSRLMLGLAVSAGLTQAGDALAAGKPNVVFVLADDLGYGDLSCLNPAGKIKTPNLDRLSREGMIFTDAHSSSAVCSPSRYSVLTGRYNWRSRLQKGIVPVYGNPLIAKDRLTVPGLLKQYGYHSACIGKWHLGMGWDFDAADGVFLSKNGKNPAVTPELQAKWQAAFSKPTTGGPTTRGFDYYFGVDVPNWPPYCFIENDRTVGIPSTWLSERLLGNNQAGPIGPAMPYWNFEQLLPTWAQKADDYIKARAAAKEPFFLYMALTSPHTPISVNKSFIGKSGLNNLYADFVIETDDVFGRILDSLKRYGVEDNTLIIFSSDNGCAHYIGTYVDAAGFHKAMEPQGHFSSGPYRGYKSDIWDGGHRVPFIARWPGVIAPGSRSDELVCLSDLMATCADILGAALPATAGEDSVSLLPLFRNPASPVRDHVIHHSINGQFAIRDGRWKLVLCPGSGGWTLRDADAAKDGLPMQQLYDMKNDPGEKTNRYAQEPEQVKKMLAQLQKDIDSGRSTPGAPQTNDTRVIIWKADASEKPQKDH
ncbi:MAG TPA: arylsulfatase [Pontiellaceae bacterium]|nr:arylsulfatase [Pontiellaceae bacterium]